MNRIVILFLLIVFSSEETILKKSRRSKHGEDCYSDAACEEGLVCRTYRCYTNYESKNLKSLGLLEKNLCDLKKKCKADKICVKHRCVDKNTPIETTTNKTKDIDDVHLLFTGGINLNKKPYLSGLKADNTINYDHLFTHLTKNIQNADLAIASQQTVFHIEEGNKLKKDAKNTPKELGDALAKAGFKVVLHGSPAAFSHKEKGITNTLNFWKNYHPDICPLGIVSTEEEKEKNYYIFNKNNIKVGIINYSGLVPKGTSAKNKFMVNTISDKKIEEDLPKLKKEVDFLVVCLDWGEKTTSVPNKLQIKWAKELAKYGANLIVGNYPSHVQPVTYVKAKNGNTALVMFSLGTLVGDNGKKSSFLGALANVVISKADNKTYISSFNLIPTLNHKTAKEYTVYKLSEYDEDLGKEVDKKFSLEKVKKACKADMGAFAYCH